MSDPPRRRGRPPLDPTSQTVVVPFRMSERAYAEISALAKGAHISFGELVRRRLVRLARPTPPIPPTQNS